MLAQVGITFVSRTDKQVTIKGQKYRLTTFRVYFTQDFWSEKNKFHGLGGSTTEADYEFGRVPIK
jgi:hypothetical protein